MLHSTKICRTRFKFSIVFCDLYISFNSYVLISRDYVMHIYKFLKTWRLLLYEYPLHNNTLPMTEITVSHQSMFPQEIPSELNIKESFLNKNEPSRPNIFHLLFPTFNTLQLIGTEVRQTLHDNVCYSSIATCQWQIL